MFVGSKLKAETESPKFIFIISIVSSAFEGVGFGDVSKMSQKNIFGWNKQYLATVFCIWPWRADVYRAQILHIFVPDHVLRDGCKRLVNPSD